MNRNPDELGKSSEYSGNPDVKASPASRKTDRSIKYPLTARIKYTVTTTRESTRPASMGGDHLKRYEINDGTRTGRTPREVPNYERQLYSYVTVGFRNVCWRICCGIRDFGCSLEWTLRVQGIQRPVFEAEVQQREVRR